MYRQGPSASAQPSAQGENDQEVYECPVCHFFSTDYPVLQEHVESHLEESSSLEGRNLSDLEVAQHIQNEEVRQQREASRREREDFQKLQRQYGLDGSGGYKQQALQNMEKEVALGRMLPSEYHKRKADLLEALAFGFEIGKTRTSGITEVLSHYYRSESKDIKRVWLSMGVDHYYCSLGDKGWGCGYRNFQMLLSSMLRNSTYQDCLTDLQSIPCIPTIQLLIENAWIEGFDPQGASHFNRRLQDTKAWIGACEMYSLLTSLRLKCQIIDFHQPTGPSETHPRLFEWVLNYYNYDKENSAKVVCTSKPPIYLQHQGHSRTIFGIEERKNKTFSLLIFDPGCPTQEMQKLLNDVDINTMRLIRRFAGGLRHKQYQVVAVDGVLSEEEKVARRQASQHFVAQRIP
ncbi:UNVERIFIED_CONTAM: Zinc finger-containing ubiquitin peptidase 1 [Gekko kuhli]